MEDYSYPMDLSFLLDSWSAEGCLPLADLITWAENALDKETTNSNRDAVEAVSSSVAQEEQVCASSTAEKPSHVEEPKRKARVVFSEEQLNILQHRFTLQCQLTPPEIKELAETTRLTYKQVKTWFQNRRRKLKTSNKVTWCSQAQFLPLHGLPNTPPHVPRAEGQPPLWKQFNQDTLERNFRTVAPQNQAPYAAAASASQLTVPNLPQMANWSVPPSSGHYQWYQCSQPRS